MNAVRRPLPRRWWLVGLAVAAVVVVLAPLASGDPDGLNWVAENLAFIDREEAAPYEILPGYEVPFLSGSASTVAAGVVGVALVFVAMVGIGRLLARRSRQGR